MSSGTRSDPKGVAGLLGLAASKIRGNRPSRDMAAANARIGRLGLSPRQQQLNWFWAWYRCQHYDTRKFDWGGREVCGILDHEAIATAGFIPPGFQQIGPDTLPLKFRRPTAPYALPRVIVDRFTGLLFSQRRHPVIRVPGDMKTEDYISGIAEAGRLWAAMIQARTYGGAMGSVAIGFQFVDGEPVIEVHDPRWVFPEFEDRHALKLKAIEKRYIYTDEEFNEESGRYEDVEYWYRRTIDDEKDVLYEPALVEGGEEPSWKVAKEVKHGLGECPVVWIQNLPVQDDIDGDPDCIGIFDMAESLDALIAQANRGVLSNCDPTLVLTTQESLGEIKKGSDNAIKLPNGDAKYLEINGTGPDAALSLAERLRGYCLEIAQCVLEHPDVGERRTATEVERIYSSMLAKADVLREQYGERGLKPFLEKMERAARKLGVPVQAESGELVKSVLSLPKTSRNGESVERELGPGGHIRLQWPRYFDPSLDDVNKAATAATTTKAAMLLDTEHAVKFIAEYFDVKDPQALVDLLNKQAEDRERQMQEMMGVGGMPAPEQPEMPEESSEPPEEPEDSEDEKEAAQ